MPKALKIFRIPEDVSVKIAAGEVIERPASVVKELLENSIDAGASQVSVEISDGGKRSIKITDNGCGMSQEDARLCLERFTTSKLKLSSYLLEDIDTLGFRGEALASIASVSRLSIRTRLASLETGTYIFAEAGKIKEITKAASNTGTEIEVKNLFFNFPARRKFLKSGRTEQSHIESTLEKTALPYLDKDITLISDGKKLIDMRKDESLSVRLRKLLPKNSSLNIEFSNNAGKYDIRGLLTDKGTDFRTSANLLFYINDRLIKDKVLIHAVCDALRTHITPGRYPGGAVFITMPPDTVDVNVHPAKAEVKFKDPGFIHEFLGKSVKASLTSNRSLKNTQAPTNLPETYRPFSQMRMDEKENTARAIPDRGDISIPKRNGYFSNLTVLGQLKNSYIICGDNDGVVIIDQHAAHERVTFEKLKKEHSNRSITSQEMLFPLDFEMKRERASILRENLDRFRQLGFILEEFGGNSFIIRSVPEILVNTDHVKTINDIVDMMSEFKSSGESEKIIDDILSTMACHSSVRFSRSLSRNEIDSLLSDLDHVKAKTCPHGRPFKVVFNEKELQRFFKRT